MIATARTRKRDERGIALEVGWTSVDDAIGEAIDVVTRITDEVGDEVDDVVEIELDDVEVEINGDTVEEEIAVVTIVLELGPTRVSEEGKLSVIVT